MISGNMVGSYSQIGKTFIIIDEDGNELTGVVTDKEVVFTADATTDIREGKVAATDAGIVTGSKVIPSYETTQRNWLVFPGESYSIPLEDYNRYDYTKFQGIIAKYNTSAADSVSASMVVLNDNIYGVNSSEILSSIAKNHNTKSIDLNIINNTEDIYVVYFFTYKEEV